MKRVFVALLVMLNASQAWAGFSVCVGSRCLGGGSGGSGSGSVSQFVEIDSPVSGSDACDTGDTWFNTTDNTTFTCEDGLTDDWSATPIQMCHSWTVDGATIVTGQDTYIGEVPWAATVTKASCWIIGGTSVQGTLVEYTSAGASSNTTEAVQLCDADGITTSSIDEPLVDKGDLMRVDIGTVTGNVTSLTYCTILEPR